VSGSPSKTVCVPLSYSGNPGVSGVSDRGLCERETLGVGGIRDLLKSLCDEAEAGASSEGALTAGELVGAAVTTAPLLLATLLLRRRCIILTSVWGIPACDFVWGLTEVTASNSQ
jgi:hypothetical protein